MALTQAEKTARWQKKWRWRRVSVMIPDNDSIAEMLQELAKIERNRYKQEVRNK